MKKATLALIIGSTLSSVISFANAATVIDAPNNYDPVFTSGESSLLENTALTVFQHDSAINNLTAQASDQGQQLTAQSLRIDQNNYDINQQHSQLTELNNRAGKTEKDVTLLELQRQGLQAAIIDHGDRMNSLQEQTDAEVSARTTLGNQVDGNKQAIVNLSSTTKTALINNATENEEQNKALNVLNGQIQMTGTYAKSRTDAAIANIESNKAALAKTNQAVAAHSAELANHESRIDALEANTGAGNSFARLKNQVDDNRQRASAGIAGVAAMANIPQVTQGATFSVGAGAGTTDGESALAVGFSARATENTVIKASVSNDSQQNFVVGAGAAYQW
ncbi:YadA-like family protein [Cedecea davisae]|uniref:YadA C-terminal domain-containing protein n=1 Tax=Cedecea davisae TaxID=158484 RepID=UPI00376EC863